MATVRTTYPGILALQTEVWTLSLVEAKATSAQLQCTTGSYWHMNLLKPMRRAQRAKATTVTIYTGGFSSGEFSNALYAAGHAITA